MSSSLTRALIPGSLLFLAAFTTADAVVPRFALPHQLPPAERARLEGIMKNSFASTRAESAPYAARPEVWEFLLDHPEFATHVTRALKLARYRIWHDGTELWLDDGWGVRGQFTVVHAEPGLRLMYARGQFEPKLLPEIHGEGVATLQYAFHQDDAGRTLVVATAAGCVQVDNTFLNALAKVAAPMVQAKADKEAGYLLRVFARVSRAIEEEPARVYQLVSERPDVPRADLEEFRRVLHLP